MHGNIYIISNSEPLDAPKINWAPTHSKNSTSSAPLPFGGDDPKNYFQTLTTPHELTKRSRIGTIKFEDLWGLSRSEVEDKK